MKKLMFLFSSILVVLMTLIGVGKTTNVVSQNTTQNQYETQEEIETESSIEETSIDQYGYSANWYEAKFTKYSSTVAANNQIYYDFTYTYAHKTGASCGVTSRKVVTMEIVSYTKGTSTQVNAWTVTTWTRDLEPGSGTQLTSTNTGTTYSITGYYTLSFIPNFTAYDYKLRVSGWGDLGTTGGNCNTYQVQNTSPILATPSPVTYASYSWSTTPDTTTGSGAGQSTGTFTYNATINNPTNLTWYIGITLSKVSGPGTFTTTTKYIGKPGYASTPVTSQTFTGLESGATYQATVTRQTTYGEIIGWSNQIITFTIGSAVSQPTAVATATATPSNGSDGSITNSVVITNQSDQYTSKIETSIDNGTTWLVDDTGVNSGTTGTLTTTHTGLTTGTYTVKTRVTYSSNSGNNLVMNLADQTVTVPSASITYPAPTININYTSTNTTTPVATNGTISGSYTCNTNCNGNIIAVEIQTNNSGNWTDISTGITGLTAGTYQVSYRVSYDSNSNAGVQQAYGTTSTNTPVTVSATPYGAPTASFTFSTTNATYPGANDGTIKITPTVTPVSGTADIYYRVESTPSTNGWTTTVGSSTYTRSGLSAGTYYADVYVMYDADGIAGNEARLDLAEQQITVSQDAWEAPVLSMTAVASGSNAIDVDVNLTAGDYEAIQNVYLEVTTLSGVTIDSTSFTGSQFSDSTESWLFDTGLTPGNYYIKAYYTFDLGDGQGLQTSTVFQMPVSLNAKDMPTITSGTGYGNGTESNATSSATTDGDYTNTIVFNDADEAIQSTGNTVDLYKFNINTGIWELYSTDTISFTGTTTKTLALAWTDELSTGYYRYNLNLTVNTGTGNQLIKFVAPTGFFIDRANLDAVSASQQGYYVDDYNVDLNTGAETYDITYYLTTTNTDGRAYQYKVELWDLNDTATDTLVETQYVNKNTSEVVFNDVASNPDYEIRISKDTVGLPTGTDVLNITTSYNLTGQTDVKSQGITLDDDSTHTAYSYTDNANNQTGTITTTMIINNPDNLNYSYDVVLYDYTTGTEVDRVTFTDTTEDCDINVFTVSQLDITHQYYIQIENCLGALPTSLYTEFNGLAISSFTPAPTTQNNNWMTPAKVTGITLGAVLLTVILGTTTYILIRRKRGNK